MTLRHRPHRILYVPLDDRAPNSRVPRLLAQMVDYEMLTPPAELLGEYRTPGQPEEIASWLLAHVDPAPDCIIISLDMLVYGGLLASRNSATRTQLALQRLEVLHKLRAICPDVKILALGTNLQLGLMTSSDEAALWVDALRQYAILTHAVSQEPEGDKRTQLQVLERQIPAAVLGEYLAVRRRNFEVNRATLEYVADGSLDFLVIGQDMSASDGIHLQEQAQYYAQAHEVEITDRFLIVPGVDQLGMCLLARFVHQHMNKTPEVRVMSRDAEDDALVADGEDRPFADAISLHLALVGAEAVTAEDGKPDMLLLVNSPAVYEASALRDTNLARSHRARARDLVARATTTAEGKRLAVCDAAFNSGADDMFVQELVAATPELPRLLAYAGWQTASSSLGVVLAQGTMRLISLQDKGAFDLATALGDMAPMRYLALLDTLITSEKAHIRLLMSHFVEHWLYQSRIRPRVTEHVFHGLRTGIFDLSSVHQQAESLMRDELTQAVSDLWIDQFLGRECVTVGSDLQAEERTAVVLTELEETKLIMPWRRLKEIDFDLEFGVQLVAPGQ